MFTTHFKMSAQPFLERTPVDRIQKDERLSQGLARLEYLTESGTVGLLTGHTGVGKSSLIKLFTESLSRNLHQPIYLSLTHVSVCGILKLLVRSLGEVPKRGKEKLFLQILERLQSNEQPTFLVIDDAHLLPSEALTDLRLLVSSGLDDGPSLKILLSGQETLGDTLKRASLADLVHRISVRVHLAPLSKDETVSYIDFQMRKVNASDKIFEPEAKQVIHDYSNGIPRRINNIATACLLNASTRNVQKVSQNLVDETMPELCLP
jgi:general secretion pathway protein A